MYTKKIVEDFDRACSISEVNNKRYTRKQGQYLTFIYYYTKVNGRAPSEADMQAYFRVTAPSVHAMVLSLAVKGLVERAPGRARSLRLLISRDDLPDLE
jgi:DNA-binding MarR family transcriptional regulator